MARIYFLFTRMTTVPCCNYDLLVAEPLRDAQKCQRTELRDDGEAVAEAESTPANSYQLGMDSLLYETIRGNIKENNPMNPAQNSLSFKTWKRRVDATMLARYAIDTSDAGIDLEQLQQFWRDQRTPHNFVEWYGRKYDLVKLVEVHQIYRDHPMKTLSR